MKKKQIIFPRKSNYISSFDEIFAVDTNTKEIGNIYYSIGVLAKLIKKENNKPYRRELKIRDNRFLPHNFTLLYATVDVNDNILNKMILFCDKEASKILEQWRKGLF